MDHIDHLANMVDEKIQDLKTDANSPLIDNINETVKECFGSSALRISYLYTLVLPNVCLLGEDWFKEYRAYMLGFPSIAWSN